jgi:ribonuclease HI
MDIIRVYVETSVNGPMRVKQGVARWYRERLVDGRRIMDDTKDKGFVHGTNTTEVELTLKALINALWKLEEGQQLEIHNSCQTVHNALQYRWYSQWSKDNWVNAYGKPIKYPKLWEMLIPMLEKRAWVVKGGTHEHRRVMEYEIEKEMERWKGEAHG